MSNYSGESQLFEFKSSLVIRNSKENYNYLLKYYDDFKQINKSRNKLIHFKTNDIWYSGLGHYFINTMNSVNKLPICDFYPEKTIEIIYENIKQFGIELLKKSKLETFIGVDIIKLIELEEERSIIFED